MSDCKIYPADTVDIYGNAWQTVGENIRNGMFGKNVKTGYVNIDNGNINSTDFTISSSSENSFTLINVNCLLVFTESVEQGALDISFLNTNAFSVIRTSTNYTNTLATIKIIYKEV